MYNEFYNFSGEPFRVTPDPEFLFLTDQYKEALAAIVYGIAQRKGFICITGEVGVGKTTILRSYLNDIDRERLRFVYVFNPNLTFRSLLITILRDLGVTDFADSVPAMVERLHEYLIEAYLAGMTVVLFVDEAHNMPVGTLENMRMLSNLETATDKLIQIVLVGQPELDDLLARPELRQLRSRIAIKTRIGPLTAKESVAYIRHRLDRVATDDQPVFTAGAVARIVRQARGIPRLINILADNALINGFGYRKRPVTTGIVREVIRDTAAPATQATAPAARARAVAAAVLALALAAGAVFILEGRLPRPPTLAATLPPAPAAAPATPAPAVPPMSAVPAPAPAMPPPPDPAPAPQLASLEPVAIGPPPSAEEPPAAPSAATSPVGAEETALVTTGDRLTGLFEALSREPPPARSAAFPVERTVRPGDTLFGLMMQVYGVVDRRHVEWMQANNGDLENVNRLYVGQVLVFPRVPPARKPQQPPS